MVKEKKEYENILVEKVKSGNYLVISINRPNKLNALTDGVLEEIADALEEVESQRRIRCVVLRGTKEITKKPAFSAGADLSAAPPRGIAMGVPQHMDLWMFQKHRNYDRIEAFPKPIIAAVDGFAFGGGCELTLVCDLVIATKRSKFGFPEIKRGILPGNGGTQRMARHIGLARAKWMVYTGEPVDAETMMNWGYVAKVVDDGEPFEKAIDELATTLGTGATVSLYVIKKCMTFGTQVPLSVGLKMEQLAFGVNSAAKDVNEGVQAFMEKRPAEYKGA
ncbi:MAG: enoyl-CoA hydratase/isomerase family protein [Candidatus Hodarchaeota archaeon]